MQSFFFQQIKHLLQQAPECLDTLTSEELPPADDRKGDTHESCCNHRRISCHPRTLHL